MKTMNRFIFISIVSIFFFIVCSCISCKEKPDEVLLITIKNRTDSSIHITLFPKGGFVGLYPECEGCGGYISTNRTLYPNNSDMYEWNEVLFSTGDLNIEPYALASKAFDSIHVSLINKDSIIIKFTHENVTGYVENIFTENSTWDFNIEEMDRSDFKKRMVYQHCYRFLILESKIAIIDDI